MQKPRQWNGLIILVLAAALGVWFYFGTHPFGPRLPLKDAPVTAIDLSWLKTSRTITASNQCAQVIQTMRLARGGDRRLAYPDVGSLTVHYADGTTNRFELALGRRFNALDLVDQSGVYSIPIDQMCGTLEKVGLLHFDER